MPRCSLLQLTTRNGYVSVTSGFTLPHFNLKEKEMIVLEILREKKNESVYFPQGVSKPFLMADWLQLNQISLSYWLQTTNITNEGMWYCVEPRQEKTLKWNQIPPKYLCGMCFGTSQRTSRNRWEKVRSSKRVKYLWGAVVGSEADGWMVTETGEASILAFIFTRSSSLNTKRRNPSISQG